MILAAGPLLSLIFGIVLLYVARNMEDKTLMGIILIREMIILTRSYQLYMFISTSIPIIYPKAWMGYGGYPSDGYQIRKLLKSKNTY
ncbi:MAG TPA: hypothetical protein VK031_07890 [Tissierellaceae bacterium]|nr:hypothetical protein [Tissierellaceae bacterium]